MHKNPINSKEDFKKLQQKVEEYKAILTSLKNEPAKEEEEYRTAQLSEIEKQIETTHQEQNLKMQKQQEEIEILSTQVASLHERVFTLTEKLSSTLEELHQGQGPSQKTKEGPTLHKHSSIAKTPSFKQLRNLSIESQSLEKHEPGNRQQIIPHNRLPRPKLPSQKEGSNLNQPSAEKKFSVKLASMNDVSLPPAVTNNDAAPSKINDRLKKEAIHDLEKNSHQKATPAAPKQVTKAPPLDSEQPTDSPAQMIEPSSQKTIIPSSLISFFRKK